MREIEQIPLGWGNRMVPVHSYVAFYFSTPEALQRSMGFLRTGLDEPGTFVMFLAEEARLEGLLATLQADYPGDLQQLIEKRKLYPASWTPSFDNLSTTMMGRIDDALSEGFLRVRAMGLVDWAEVGWGDQEWLNRCEMAINWAASLYPMVILCTYNIPDLPGGLVQESEHENEPVITVHEPLRL